MDILIGLLIIAIGSFCQSSSYVPIKKVKEWSWESFWLIQGVFAWLVFPFLGSLLGVSEGGSLFELWGAGGAGMSILYGILWGVGGLTFGLSMRYLGVALGQSISLGTCAGFGTLLPALFAGTNLFEGNGLDTSFTVMYLAKEKGYEVYAACANTGGFSEEQLKTNEENAYKLGAVKYVTLDVTQEYYEKSLKYMVFGNVLRNGTYPISVSSERIFQALAIARYANEIGADAIAHGSTGAGNDQIRFDMTFLVLAPNVEIITLTRDMALSRQEEIDYLNKHGFNADFTKLKYSYNVGLWGTSICGGEILDSAQGLPETAYLKHVEKEGSEQLRLTFEKGELKAVNDEKFDDPIKAIQKVEEIGAAYGIGRDMHVGDTIIGIKGRVGFEAAAPMLIIGAHRFLEKYTLSKWQQYWKDQVANWYGMFLHESQYLEPVMRDIEAMLQESQRNVNGTAILELRPLSFSTVGVESEDDLVKTKFGEYGEMQKGWTAEDAKGFIKVTSTPLRVYYNNHKDEEI